MLVPMPQIGVNLAYLYMPQTLARTSEKLIKINLQDARVYAIVSNMPLNSISYIKINKGEPNGK